MNANTLIRIVAAVENSAKLEQLRLKLIRETEEFLNKFCACVDLGQPYSTNQRQAG